MALSNWFMVAWDEEFDPINYIPKLTAEGIDLHLRKNWLSLLTFEGEKQQHNFTVESGTISFYPFNIEASRGPQNSIFFKISKHLEDGTEKIFYGIAGYGYKKDDWVGCEPETLEKFKEWLEWLENKDDDYFDEQFVQVIAEATDKPIVDLRDEFLVYIKEAEEQRFVADIAITEAKCYNQGDIYFAEQFNAIPESSEIGGKQITPFLNESLSNFEKKLLSKIVMVCHKYETVDKKHHVSWRTESSSFCEDFDKWIDAILFAYRIAKEMEPNEIIVDHPDNPHGSFTLNELEKYIKAESAKIALDKGEN